jgi:hypothetical protein
MSQIGNFGCNLRLMREKLPLSHNHVDYQTREAGEPALVPLYVFVNTRRRARWTVRHAGGIVNRRLLVLLTSSCF